MIGLTAVVYSCFQIVSCWGSLSLRRKITVNGFFIQRLQTFFYVTFFTFFNVFYFGGNVFFIYARWYIHLRAVWPKEGRWASCLQSCNWAWRPLAVSYHKAPLIRYDQIRFLSPADRRSWQPTDHAAACRTVTSHHFLKIHGFTRACLAITNCEFCRSL